MNIHNANRPAAPILRWLGGKRRLAKKLLPLFPAHHCCVEIFCGGAALYFLRPEPAPVEVINDINGELMNLYRVVQHHLGEFAQQFKWALTSRQLFKWYQVMQPETLTDIQRAARFYYLQQNAFGGHVAKQTFGTTTTRKPSMDWQHIEEKVLAAHHRIASTETSVESLPWLKCIERYDRHHTFFYLDPPYWKTEGYGVPFGFEEYERMAEVMRTCKGKVMLSINDHPDMRAVFKGFRMVELDIVYSAGLANRKRKKSGELVIMNWEQEPLLPDAKKHQELLQFAG